MTLSMTEKRSTKGPSIPVFAERLKAARLARNWSLREMEKRAGKQLSRQTFLRAEQGDVSLENLVRIAGVLALKKRDLDELVGSFTKHQLAAAHAVA